MSKEKPPDTRSDAEKMAEWRAKRKPLDTPKEKYGWGKKKQPKKDRDEK